MYQLAQWAALLAFLSFASLYEAFRGRLPAELAMGGAAVSLVSLLASPYAEVSLAAGVVGGAAVLSVLCLSARGRQRWTDSALGLAVGWVAGWDATIATVALWLFITGLVVNYLLLTGRASMALDISPSPFLALSALLIFVGRLYLFGWRPA